MMCSEEGWLERKVRSLEVDLTKARADIAVLRKQIRLLSQKVASVGRPEGGPRR